MALTAYLTGRLFIEQPEHPDRRGAGGLPARSARSSASSTACWWRTAACLRWSSRSARSTSTAASCSPGPAATGSTPATCPASSSSSAPARCSACPLLTILALVVLAVVGYYLYTARGGRELYAIGSDPDAAVLYGLPVRRRLLAAFVLSGALAGLAGALYTARYGTVSSSVGLGIELQAVAAAVIGGVAIFGGSGTVWGAAIGAFLLVTINRALPSLGIEDFWQRAVVGALILGAIVLDRVLAVRQARKLAESRDHS